LNDGGLILEADTNSLSTQAYASIRDRILQGKLRQGQRLSLRPIARKLGMSLAPISEALRRLKHDGIIELEEGWGARVARMGPQQVREQHVLRCALECEAVRHCCERVTPAHLTELRSMAAELDARARRNEPPHRVFGLDFRFHLRIAQLSGVQSLVEAMQARQLVQQLLAIGSVVAHDHRVPARQHERIVDAIATKDADNAERVMREHCTRSMQVQLEAFTSEPAC
jgi:DNA-binding GntR family transcriptional regulator